MATARVSRRYTQESGLYAIPRAGGVPLRVRRGGRSPHFGAASDRVFFTSQTGEGDCDALPPDEHRARRQRRADAREEPARGGAARVGRRALRRHPRELPRLRHTVPAHRSPDRSVREGEVAADQEGQRRLGRRSPLHRRWPPAVVVDGAAAVHARSRGGVRREAAGDPAGDTRLRGPLRPAEGRVDPARRPPRDDARRRDPRRRRGADRREPDHRRRPRGRARGPEGRDRDRHDGDDDRPRLRGRPSPRTAGRQRAHAAAQLGALRDAHVRRDHRARPVAPHPDDLLRRGARAGRADRRPADLLDRHDPVRRELPVQGADREREGRARAPRADEVGRCDLGEELPAAEAEPAPADRCGGPGASG